MSLSEAPVATSRLTTYLFQQGLFTSNFGREFLTAATMLINFPIWLAQEDLKMQQEKWNFYQQRSTYKIWLKVPMAEISTSFKHQTIQHIATLCSELWFVALHDSVIDSITTVRSSRILVADWSLFRTKPQAADAETNSTLFVRGWVPTRHIYFHILIWKWTV